MYCESFRILIREDAWWGSWLQDSEGAGVGEGGDWLASQTPHPTMKPPTPTRNEKLNSSKSTTKQLVSQTIHYTGSKNVVWNII